MTFIAPKGKQYQDMCMCFEYYQFMKMIINELDKLLIQIKQARLIWGLGLKESKAFCESLTYKTGNQYLNQWDYVQYERLPVEATKKSMLKCIEAFETTHPEYLI